MYISFTRQKLYEKDFKSREYFTAYNVKSSILKNNKIDSFS